MKVGSLDIEIRRSARKKTISVNIERDGSVNAVVPVDCPNETIYKELLAREYTICKHVANRKAVSKAQINRQFVNGQSFLFMGESYNLEIVDGITVEMRRTTSLQCNSCTPSPQHVKKRRPMPLHIDDDKFILDERYLPKAREIFIKFYKTFGRPYIEKRIAYFAEMVGRAPSAISIRELGAHWASCTPKQKINFHWKCIMAPPKVIDYLIVHELTHLKYPQHTRHFWDAVFSVMPNYKECEDWLHDYGVTLDL